LELGFCMKAELKLSSYWTLNCTGNCELYQYYIAHWLLFEVYLIYATFLYFALLQSSGDWCHYTDFFIALVYGHWRHEICDRANIILIDIRESMELKIHLTQRTLSTTFSHSETVFWAKTILMDYDVLYYLPCEGDVMCWEYPKCLILKHNINSDRSRPVFRKLFHSRHTLICQKHMTAHHKISHHENGVRNYTWP
jgi:hypothetical protein